MSADMSVFGVSHYNTCIYTCHFFGSCCWHTGSDPTYLAIFQVWNVHEIKVYQIWVG